jgi:hypothetical protein
MQSNPVIRFVVILAAIVAVLGTAPVRGTAFSTDQSDVWWNPGESGWGLQFVQTGSAIFATMAVYEPSGQPIWYSALLIAQPEASTWSGELIVTTGPWLGTVPFDPALVSRRAVGTMTWHAQSAESGTLTYTVDNVLVSTTVYRETLLYDNHAGAYFGNVETTLCGDTLNQTSGFPATISVTQDANQLVVRSPMPSVTNVYGQPTSCTFTGDYAQSGHFGRSQGTFACSDGSHGTHVFTEMTVRKLGWAQLWSTLLTASYSSGCTITAILSR